MLQTRHSNSSDSREIPQENYPSASSRGVLEQVYPFVDPDTLEQENNDVIADGPHIILTCGPYDDEEEEE